MGPHDQASELYLLLIISPLEFLELGLEMAAPHFQAQLGPGPHVPDSPLQSTPPARPGNHKSQ